MDERLLRDTLVRFDAPPSTPPLQHELRDVCRDLIRDFYDIRDFGNRHHLLAVTEEGYDFLSREEKHNEYLDNFIASSERALKLVEPPQRSEDQRIVEHLRACLEEARVCRFPNQDYADRPEVQESVARSEQDILGQ